MRRDCKHPVLVRWPWLSLAEQVFATGRSALSASVVNRGSSGVASKAERSLACSASNPAPRVEAVRIADMSLSNAWSEFAGIPSPGQRGRTLGLAAGDSGERRRKARPPDPRPRISALLTQVGHRAMSEKCQTRGIMAQTSPGGRHDPRLQPFGFSRP
jgi:hypothetical protein